MKRTLSTTVKTAGIIVITLLVMATSVKAQNVKQVLKEKQIKSLLVALQHENEGVRKDAIYYSVVYGVYESVPVLIEDLKTEKNPKVRLLIALALYKLGSPEGIEAVYQSALNDSDAKVRRMCNAIVAEYQASVKELAVKTE